MGFNSQVQVTAKLLNCRLDPNMNSQIHSVIKANEIYNIVAEQDGWGQLENGTWIKLEFTAPVVNQEEPVEALEINTTVVDTSVVQSDVNAEAAAESATTFATSDKKIEAKTDKAKNKTKKQRTHKVKDKESLWDIAEMYLGDGERYLEIKELNKLTSDILQMGMILKIPNE